MEKELTKEQIDRQDYVDNVIHQMLQHLISFKKRNPYLPVIKWDQHIISEVRAVVSKYFVDELKLCTEKEFYP